jgi:hypothetical protein
MMKVWTLVGAVVVAVDEVLGNLESVFKLIITYQTEE